MSVSLQPHGLQHPRFPCPSPSPRACSNSCPLSQGCYPTIWSSVVPLSSCLLSFPASQSFPMSWLVTSGCQSIGASASASVLPMNIQGWLPWGLTGLISLQSKGLSRVFSWEYQFFSAQPSLWSSPQYPSITTGKTIALIYGPLSAKWCLCFFNMLSRFVIGLFFTIWAFREAQVGG